MDNFVITIARQYGSGGRTVGEMLAKKLGIGYYDKDIIRMASEDSGIHETLFGRVDEYSSAKKPLFGKNGIYSGELIPPQSKDFTSDENLFNFQAKIIRELAEKESCVIIGRCSDVIVEDAFRIFICSSFKKRVERIQGLEKEPEDLKKLESRIRAVDAKRRDYYQYYSGNEWGNPRNYHLSLNSGKLGIEKCVDMILESLKLYEQ